MNRGQKLPSRDRGIFDEQDGAGKLHSSKYHLSRYAFLRYCRVLPRDVVQDDVK